MHRRKLEELNLLDDFMMFKVVNHPKLGQKFSRILLEIILGRMIGRLTIVPQKVYYGSDTDAHGARLDVYLEEDVDTDGFLENATLYDLEPEKRDKAKNIKSLPQRVRFYHSKIDVGSLESGADYGALKNVIVIMIMPFDPFGKDQIVYTIRNSCKEVPELPYDDGAKTLFFYTKGTKGNVSEELRELLKYMEESIEENAKSENLKEIHEIVKIVKQDKEASREYMRIMESRRELIEEGLELGQELERKNTERERQRAEEERQRADRADQYAKETKVENVMLWKIIRDHGIEVAM